MTGVLAPPAIDTHRATGARWQWAVAIAVFVAAFLFGLPKFAAYDDVWHQLVAMDRGEVAVLATAAAWNVVTYWFALMAALPGLSLRQAAISNQASTAVSNVVPGGAAIGATLTWSMYTHWGFSREAASRALLLTSAWNNFFKFGLPFVALALTVAVPSDRTALSGAIAVASCAVLGVGAATLVAATRSPHVARRVGGILGRLVARVRRDGRARATEWADQADCIRSDSAELLARRWPLLTATTVVSHLSLFAVLLVSVRTVGISSETLSLATVLAAFAVVRVALVLPVTPGGAGMAELGLTGLLVAAGGPEARVVAAVIVFRALTWLLPIGIGAAAYVLWLRELAADRSPS